MKIERWTDEYLVRGSGITLATQEHHLEEARRKGIACIGVLGDPADHASMTAYTYARFAARAALRARPDLCPRTCDCMDCAIAGEPTH